ncbi:photosystem II protein Psb27 [Crocosphaera watsonii WH 8501]|uniref:Photosystem II lipoprotein Psb27 n=5 Tax=Crocosphaera watsonii TaxID=263511 RepID=Q4C8S7_CROWT|nr:MULTISPECIES: photosystem II protein Psb27 [Crocosphaera]EAM52194.1 photosystem II 11 kD protein [Crocosphaera watsonii WH 8501]EHJ14486.1 Photosystem II protein Psb27 [Crocosphaera watsonii WH 0003]MCH2243870.1 photosystem II protein Psb27 [Crocosphaera sp.]NQZ61458.1 photosystem II protein Psb27 [Crocosphaera sp.]CCQ54256.1 Photosystem II protein Psb27 [Crocosphaera watsonii WH 0005]
MFFKSALSRILALVLVAVVTLTGCGNSSSGLSGNYSEDTLAVIETLTTALDLPNDAENKQEIKSLAKEQINDYISRYRRNGESGGLRSFTTMQTALNSLAGYYTSYGNRPLPEKLKKRLKQEFKQAEVAIKRGI